MPRPDRTMSQGGGSSSMSSAPSQSQGMPMGGGGGSSGNLRDDLRTINSNILLITQKMKYIARNEKILGRNLIVLNKKIKTIEDKQQLTPTGGASGGASDEEVSALKQKIALLEAQIDDMRSRTATKEEVKELKFVIDSINPLEFATLSQVSDIFEKKLAAKQAKK